MDETTVAVSGQQHPAKRRRIQTTIAQRLFRLIENQIERKGMPCNLEMEKETLCATMLGEDSYTGIIFDGLDSMDFNSPVYREIFDALRKGWENGVPFNTPALLVQWIRDCGVLARLRKMMGESRIGVEDFLAVMQSHGLAINAEYYVRSLRKLRAEREIWLLLLDGARDAKNGSPYEWLEVYSKKLNDLKQEFGSSS